MRYRYPRTPHLPWSPGAANDDMQLGLVEQFVGQEVLVTEKLDGECTTMYRDHIHARPVDSGHHSSRDWVKKHHADIAHLIPPDWRLCGENLYARHSIAYKNLESYFYLFSIWNDENRCLSWPDTEEWSELLGCTLVPVLYRGLWNEETIRGLSFDTNSCEGYVVRSSGTFAYEDFTQHVAKWVRPGHVQTDDHWMHRAVTPNQLGSVR